VGIVTDTTAITHCIVLEDKRASLLFVALEAFFFRKQQHRPTCSPHVTSVHIMAVIAEHSAFGYGMMVLEQELAFNIKVTGKARRFSIRPDNLALVVHVFEVKAPRSVTRLTGLCLTCFSFFICYVDGYTCMVGELEILVLCFVALDTAFNTDIFGAWN
jgi:hypothetical protein